MKSEWFSWLDPSSRPCLTIDEETVLAESVIDAFLNGRSYTEVYGDRPNLFDLDRAEQC